MDIRFKNLRFVVENGRVWLAECGKMVANGNSPFLEVQICGENKDSHMGVKMANSSEGKNFRYCSHTLEENRLQIVQETEKIRATTTFLGIEGADAVRIYTEVENISAEEIVLEEVSAFVAYGLGARGIDSADELYFTRFLESHHAECQPRRASFREWGLFRANVESQKRIAFANVGSWSTKEELPQGIIEDEARKTALAFQIESNSAWYYEIADRSGEYYLYLGGNNATFGGWSKALAPNERYRTVTVGLAFAADVQGVLGELTALRRAIAGKCAADEALPVIFNEYMHLSWDSPTAENTARVAPIAAALGAKYYVIDCGWHNEEDGDKVYPYIGQWKESKARFPDGVRKTTDYIRSLGMKAGLWIEPEVIGIWCKDMLAYYDDDCFLQRHGKRLAVMNRHFLDFRAEKVRAYMTETIRRMVEDYGADYIKFDYNQDCGVGTDYAAFCAAEGLEECAAAYLRWVEEVRTRFPNVLFETCSSGGMRMDYQTLSRFSIVSTSDQTDYLKYPYIAGNVLAAVLPEQAAVWSYPVGVGEIGKPLPYDAAWVQANISRDRIAMNMVNSFLGRMHLASHLELMNDEQRQLVAEGVRYYDSLTNAKKKSTPYFPCGFTAFEADNVVAGFKTEKTIYLAVWKLKAKGEVVVPIREGVRAAKLAYPSDSSVRLTAENGGLRLEFPRAQTAAFFEIEVQ